MVICKNLELLHYCENSVLTIGSMDGMHRGHAEILSYLKKISIKNKLPSVVVTFDPHPKTVLEQKGKTMQFLLSIDKKMEIFERKGIDYVWIIPFNKYISKISAVKFMSKYIIEYFNPDDIIIGYDHHFGHNREGGKEFLNSNKDKYDYNLHIIDPILYHNTPISSSRIRAYIDNCKIVQANECLGWKYEVSGMVVRGRGMGTKLKFPTANVQPYNSSQLIPPFGVYCVDVIIEDSYYTGMCNIGKRPTFYDNGKEIIEVHLFSNDNLNLYEKSITLKFKKYLRPEKKYASANELIQQLELDRQLCFTV